MLDNSHLHHEPNSATLKIMRKSRSGFTVIEVLVVIVIIAILATISIVAYTTIQHKAYDAKVQSALDAAEKAIRTYTLKGNKIRLRHYHTTDFYAAPGGGGVESGIPTFSGGGLGRELQTHRVLDGDIQTPLKSGGPKKDISLQNRIRIIMCGRQKLFVIIESYSGILESELNQRMRALQCDRKTYEDWLKEHGLPAPSAGGWASGEYRDEPRYKIAEIDL